MDGQRDAARLPPDFQAEIEAIARRLGCDDGEWVLEFKVRDGTLAQTRLHHGPIRNEELDALARNADLIGASL